jgi:hypothetical protein
MPNGLRAVQRFFRTLILESASVVTTILPDRGHRSQNVRKIRYVIAAGDAATSCFLNCTVTGAADDRLARMHLKKAGVGFWESRRLMRRARENALRCVQSLESEIFDVAEALREHRTLTQSQIDALL